MLIFLQNYLSWLNLERKELRLLRGGGGLGKADVSVLKGKRKPWTARFGISYLTRETCRREAWAPEQLSNWSDHTLRRIGPNQEIAMEKNSL